MGQINTFGVLRLRAIKRCVTRKICEGAPLRMTILW